MAHPFQKMFIKALAKSDDLDNQVTDEAVKLIKKGYRRTEIFQVLKKLEKSLIEDKEKILISETIEELSLEDTIEDLEL